MAHITEFNITGLAGRKEPYSRKLNREINILFGENGSGKTSLLKILHSAMGGDVEPLRHVAFESAEVAIYSITHERVFRRKFEKSAFKQTLTSEQISLYDQVRNYRYYLGEATIEPLWLTEPEYPDPHEPKKPRWPHRYLPISRLYVGRDLSTLQTGKMTPLSEEQLDTYFASSIASLWQKYSADISLVIRAAQEKGLANILKTVLSPGKPAGEFEFPEDPSDAYQHVRSFLERQPEFSRVLGKKEDFAELYKKDPDLRRIVSDIEQVERTVRQATTPTKQLQDLLDSMVSGNKKIKLGDKDIEVEAGEKIKIALSTLSSGEKQLLRIMVETLMAKSNSIIIDEPELSMHVDWQRRLIKSMLQLNPHAQLITATHSPEIMADAPDDSIFRI